MKNSSKSFINIYFLIFLYEFAHYQADPILTSWKKSTGTGYAGITADVDKVEYTADYVSIHTSCIPSYSIGPWINGRNNASNIDATYKITRNPTVSTTKTATPNGAIGVLINGVALYNALDTFSYNDKGI